MPKATKAEIDRITRIWMDARDFIDVAYITAEQIALSDMKDGPRLPSGVRGCGWYWFFKDRTTGERDDEWWCGPDDSAADALYDASETIRHD
jgi:hypothetical protein